MRRTVLPPSYPAIALVVIPAPDFLRLDCINKVRIATRLIRSLPGGWMERTSARVPYLSTPLTGIGQKWCLDLLSLEAANEKRPYLAIAAPSMSILFRRLELNLVNVSEYGRTVYEAIRRVTFGRRLTPLSYILRIPVLPGTRATECTRRETMTRIISDTEGPERKHSLLAGTTQNRGGARTLAFTIWHAHNTCIIQYHVPQDEYKCNESNCPSSCVNVSTSGY